MAETLQSAFGLVAIMALAWALGENRRRARLRVAVAGIGLQLAVAALVLKVPAVTAMFDLLNEAVLALQRATDAGTGFVFGYLGGAPLPFEETAPGASFVLAFRALPLILVVSALSALLVHWRILPLVVRGFAIVLERALGLGGAVGLGAAANIFMGMLEAPLLIRPWLARLTRSELFVLMTTGMATIAGTMFVLYATILGPVVPGAAGHLLVASIISAPAAVSIALLMVPETETRTPGGWIPPRETAGPMEAIVVGTGEGLRLLLNVVAMLVVLVALVHLANAILGLLPGIAGAPLSLERVLGWLMAPLAWLMGIPWAEAQDAGALLGVKVVLNELLAYLRLVGAEEVALSERSRLILTYAMCGFANFGSLGILIGGLVALVPERRPEIVSLGMRSLVAGNLATFATGAVVGIF